MAKKKFRVGVAARTIDGREIKPEFISSAAASYDPNVYGARINLEHIRGVMPDSPFGAYGDVIAVEYKEDVIGGKKRGALYAEIEPTDELIELNKKGQKVYTSMELQPDFPEEGSWYLVGLAITDSPASMGTQKLSFSAAEKEKNHLFSGYEEIEFIDADDEDADTRLSIVERIKAMFISLKAAADKKGSELEQAIELLAQEFTALAQQLPADNSEDVASLKSELASLQESFNTLQDQYAAIDEALNSTEQFSRRPPASGGQSGNESVTDC